MLSCVHLTILLITQYLCLKLAVNSIFSENYAKAIEKNTLKYAFGNHFSYPFILLENKTDTLALLISVSRCTFDISYGYKITFLNIHK